MKAALLLVAAVACGSEQHHEAAATVTLPAPSPSAAPSASEATTSVGVIGVLQADPNAPTAPWGREDSLNGGDHGNMWGDGLAGGVDASVGQGATRARTPTIRQGSTTVTSGLPPEVIQRIVRQSFGRYRLCYDRGLQKTPGLAGTVAVRFTIDSTGAVAKVERGQGTSMPDSAVVDCVLRAFGNLSFPQPTTGASVVVNYPIRFAPGD